MSLDITHAVSENGLELVSSALIDGRLVTLTTGWATEEQAEDHYYIARQAHDQRLREIATQGVQGYTSRKVGVRRLFSLGGVEVYLGHQRGQAFDHAMFALGKRVWRAPLGNGTKRARLRDWHRGTDAVRDHDLYGIGGRTWATYLRVQQADRMR